MYLAAQTQAIGFYEQHGSQITGDVFLGVGIPHQNLILKLPTQPQASPPSTYSIYRL